MLHNKTRNMLVAAYEKPHDAKGIALTYGAPAMNIHCSAFAGRKFEYYSEGDFVSGKLAANAIIGVSETGVYSFMKHFALIFHRFGG